MIAVYPDERIAELVARVEALERALREIAEDCPDWKYGNIARAALKEGE